ncbi:MAG TPA: hypothetical protein VHS06_02475 [Chloroflexota bacterium]|nr:hypothetical protein [Chloroflexota bacterium]HEX2987017.1 hypothetical protein [Chloroflexota bacterium]
MRNPYRPIAVALLILAVALIPVGCSRGGASLLSELRPSASVVAPTGKGDTPPITVGYTLSRPATIGAYLVGGNGEKLYLQKDEVRPVAGDYSLSFIGAYAPDPSGLERKVVPAGSYPLVIEAVDGAGARQEARTQLQVRDSDTVPPTIAQLTLYPDSISPNFDGIDDTVKITYRSAKVSTVSVYLVSADGKRFVLEREEGQTPGEHSTTWDGQISNQLLASGSYRFIVEAEDAAGNVSAAEKTLKIDSASQPDAHILSVTFQPQKILLGQTVKVEMRVKNTGNTVLKTQGPDPGYTYSSQEGFSTVAGGKYRDQKGLWRVGVDWAGGPGAAGSKYPYRWGFGKDLQPGEEVTVVGYIKMEHTYPQIWVYAGLVQEQVRYWDSEVGRTVIETGY